MRTKILLTVALILCGCSTVKSWEHSADTRTGVIYGLPMNLVQLKAWRGPDVDRLKKIATDAGVAAKQRTALEKQIVALEKSIKTGKDAKGNRESETQLLAAKKKLRGVAESLSKLAKEKAAAEKPMDRVSLEVLPAVADPDQIYVAEGLHNLFRDDELDLMLEGASENGLAPASLSPVSPLLKRATVTADDKTGEVILNIVKAYIQFSTGVPGKKEVADMQSIMRAGGDECIPEANADYTRVFDPFTESADTINEELEPHCYEIYFKTAKGSDAMDSLAEPPPRLKESAGIVYRQGLPYILGMKHTVKTKQYLHKSIQIVLPNAGPIGVLPMPSGAFVRSEYQAHFSNGMLVKSKATRPSEALAVSLLPLALFEAIAGGVTEAVSEVVKFKVDTSDIGTSAEKAKIAAGDAAADSAGETPPAP